MKKRQSGASMISMMLMLLVGAAILTVALKIIPVYVDSWTISKAIEKVSKDENLANLSDREIIKQIDNQLSINGVRDFDMKNVIIKRDEGKMLVTADYEVRTHIVKNIDAVLSFENKIETTSRRD